ncbi:MAG: amidohydrolase family protein, partial [Xanthobacteraceae bacterium]
CTTVFDHHTALPGDVTLDMSIEAAATLGIRFVAGRGARTLGSAPAALRETSDRILADFERLIDRHHDPRPHAMSQVCIAPPQLGTIEREFAIELIEFARAKGVRGHTHLGETADEIGAYMARFGMRPYQYAEDVGWIAQDTWLAHGVHFDAGEIAGLARAGLALARITLQPTFTHRCMDRSGCRGRIHV